MAAAMTVRPDAAFIKDVVALGGADLKKCMQCATCSVACELSPEEAPFPRRQMIEAQWGLKEQVLADPALWLCHACGRCSTLCPRGAKPAEAFAALRMLAIRQYAFPAFLGRMATDPRWLPVMFLIPLLIFGSIALWAPKPPVEGNLEFAHVFPIPVLEAFFFALSGFLLVAFAVGIRRFMAAMRRGGARGGFWTGIGPALRSIVTHERFAQCAEPGKDSFRWGHQLTLWGFLGLAFMGTVVGIGSMTGLMRTPLELTHPLKIFANVSSAAILLGLALLYKARLEKGAAGPGATFFDWFFLSTLAGVAATGMLSQLLRLAQAAPVLYVVYFVHLVLIFVLFLYAPYSKFAHLAYRTVAIALSEPWKPKRPVSDEDQKKLMELYY